MDRSRLLAVDFLRGLALTIVLIDHVEWWAGSVSLFRSWTLMGLGLSDAAEAFVFLSGFTFGWVYSTRVRPGGFLKAQKRTVSRCLRIHLGFLVAVVLELILVMALGESQHRIGWRLNVTGTEDICRALWQAALLRFQPFGLGILCMYVVILPWMPGLLAMCRRWKWAVLCLSAAIYTTSQPVFGLSLPGGMGIGGWFFNPISWQFLFVTGMVCGHSARDGAPIAPKLQWWTVLAIGILLYGLWVRKVAPWWLGDPRHDLAQRIPFALNESWLVAKSNLGPLRLLHFLALAHLVTRVLPRSLSAWQRPMAKALIATGRHSLSVYCAGTVLAFSGTYVFERLGATKWTVIAMVLDACALQFLFAIWLERRRTTRERAATTAVASSSSTEFVRTG